MSRARAAAMIEREAGILRCLVGVKLPVPRLVAFSRPGETDGSPALLMTQVPGRMDLAPRDPSCWIGQMARTLGGIHALDLNAPTSEPWSPTPEVEIPTWSSRLALWERADTLLSAPAPSGESFIHGDYQHFNLLWSRGRLSGIVDWSIGGMGHPDRDVGHCRLNLAALFSPRWASDFIDAYESEVGRRVEGWWDVYEISRYGEGHMRQSIPIQAGRDADVDVGGMNDRVERLLADALERHG
jgi:aminoglycoside phosphotransferase (APT) family kinase protein